MSPQKTAVKSGKNDQADDPRFKQIDRTLKRFQYQQDALIEVLHTAQESMGYLDEDVLTYVSHQLKLPLSWVYGVATFYHFFSLKPQGDHICSVCMGTACYVKGSEVIAAALRAEYGIKPGETTEDGKVSLAEARCVGSCGLAPVVIIDGQVVGKATPEQILQRVREKAAMPVQKPVAA